MYKLVLAFSACMFWSLTQASEVGALTGFTSGQPALASEVNQNFSNLKTAVDDNDLRLDSIETALPGKQDVLSGSNCAVGTVVQSIASDGTASCVAPVLNGSVSVPGNAFRLADDLEPDCTANAFNWRGNITSTLSSCSVTAPIQIPQGATVNALRCSLQHHTVGMTTDFRLNYANHATGGFGAEIFASNPATGFLVQTVTDTTANTAEVTVDNASRIYYLMAFVANSSPPSPVDMEIQGCIVDYTF